jgi:hypothetical protein
LVDGGAADASPLERALMALVRKAHHAAYHLEPADLDALRLQVGAGALDYALVLVTFHWINRIADLLGVNSELPVPRRFEGLRRFGTKVASVAMRATMDLENRPYAKSYDEVLKEHHDVFERALGHPPGDDFAAVAERPKVIEAIALMLEEQQRRSGLASGVQRVVVEVTEAALPRSREDALGFHVRPSNPVEAFAFVGTRYANRATPSMVAALRRVGYDDRGILDLAIAIADANLWARLRRLLDLPSLS